MTELEELKKLLAEAEKQSPLPWYTNGTSLFDDATYKLCDYLDPPEAALIVAAVNALPGLIARVEENERLRDELEAAAYQFKFMVEHYDWMMKDMPEPSMRNSAEIVARYQVHAPNLRSSAETAEADARAALRKEP